jgi:hypothetical protein
MLDPDLSCWATAPFANSALRQIEQNITFWGRFYASNAARASMIGCLFFGNFECAESA